ncbi:unnamed protein product [Ceutorhynchus assimilis]|uniref:CHK kinase-like domain-containing protein n=1 Tax=Ceutorhynchus assimilis TaxID=467358 RepID=A0A9N9QL76_9CUCU|nr:unnamed protein product [Ceutorhynchus assimilis]
MANKKEIEKLEDLIKGTIDGELVEQQVSSLLPPGENYGSVMYKVDFKVKTSSGEIKEYHAVAKCTPLNQVTQEMFNTQVTFKSEIAWYTTVIPTLKSFAKEQGLRRELDFFQQFYGARISLDPESDKVDLDGVILTENLKYLGFKNIDRHQGFDEPTTISILNDLAAFHAVPMAIRALNPNLFNDKVKPYCPKFGMSKEMGQDFLKSILDVFNYIPHLDAFRQRIDKNFNESCPFERTEIREPWVTSTHLDFWTNNIMTNGLKNVILDLQMPAVGSPAGDLIFFLLTSVNFDLIQTKIDEFTEIYYRLLIGNLIDLKVDTQKYSFESFLKEINLEMKYTEFAHSLAHCHMILLEKGHSGLDSADANYKPEDFQLQETTKPNGEQIRKFTWITEEALKRNWI